MTQGNSRRLGIGDKAYKLNCTWKGQRGLIQQHHRGVGLEFPDCGFQGMQALGPCHRLVCNGAQVLQGETEPMHGLSNRLQRLVMKGPWMG